MQTPEILDRINNGEDSTTQFKQDVTDANRLAEELVAFSNAAGGLLLIGVCDDGTLTGLSETQIGRINQLLSNTANENIKPPIYPLTEILNIQGKRIIAVSIRKGINRPYQTNKGVYFTKSGSDKRKMSPEELRRLFAESERLFADEETLLRTDITDLNTESFYAFLDADNRDVYEALKQAKLELPTVLHNLELLRDGHLTLAGNLIFGKTPQRFSPSFYVDCVHFDGDDVSVGNFITKATIKGSLSQQYESSMQFLRINLRSIPTAIGFNAHTRLEVDEAILGELLVNALVHRDYYIQSSVKVFVFQNRVEIISPGKLPNSLTVEKIKNGLSVHRNPILNSVCRRVLPYSGYGSGIKRVVKLNPSVTFIDDREKEEFRCLIPRNPTQNE
ncbi:RNA-binding domain-containing protein [Candidatus Thiothrix anitrata]|uniref:DNA binding domain-containing protein n=1 Tax=Candidatus Thiothrix anitrata TaxID=2823902 RepID=A0ABX7X3W4_9GAMM|nr:RNA-binding domain-containing protein [Candidatus Thiothrix anitrata]QTR49388.1 putative DNA binding domain-containing protein [Candidatus Thiothrix anitrata]